MDETLVLPQEFIAEMVAHALEDRPAECCGVVARFPDGRLKLFRASNGEEAGQRPYRFAIPAGELHYLYRAIEDLGGDLYAVYHSHTMTEAQPSPTDATFSRLLDTANPWPYWVVVSLKYAPPQVRAWRMRDGLATEIRLEGGPLPPGSARVRLCSDGEARHPRVEEAPLSS